MTRFGRYDLTRFPRQLFCSWGGCEGLRIPPPASPGPRAAPAPHLGPNSPPPTTHRTHPSRSPARDTP